MEEKEEELRVLKEIEREKKKRKREKYQGQRNMMQRQRKKTPFPRQESESRAVLITIEHDQTPSKTKTHLRDGGVEPLCGAQEGGDEGCRGQLFVAGSGSGCSSSSSVGDSSFFL